MTLNVTTEVVELDALTPQEEKRLWLTSKHTVYLAGIYETLAFGGKVIHQTKMSRKLNEVRVGGKRVLTVQWHGKQHEVRIDRVSYDLSDGRYSHIQLHIA